MKKKISLLFLSLLLVGCNGQSETDKLPSESVVPPTDKTTTTTPAYTVDLSDIITELSFGFSGSTLFKSGYDILGFNENYHDFKIGDKSDDDSIVRVAEKLFASRLHVWHKFSD